MLRATRVHSLMPLVAKHVSEVGASSVPPALVDGLRAHSEAYGVRHRFLTVRRHGLLERLAAVGIRAIAPECRRQLLAHGYRPCADLPTAREEASARRARYRGLRDHGA